MANVRRDVNLYDHSQGDLFYQCRTCDPKSFLYLCPKCFKNGNHYGHKVTRVRNSQVAFCNCGDVTDKFYCSDHAPQRINPIPILYEKSLLDEFSKVFNISMQDRNHINLARLNQICLVEPHSEDWNLIENYFNNSNAHDFNMEVNMIWSVMRRYHEAQFVADGYGQARRMLLWHGTEKENLSSILWKGLEIPEGGFRNSGQYDGMFGPGIYLADRASKSAQYTDSRGAGLLLLCEVAPGPMRSAGHAHPSLSAPGDLRTIKGVGKNIPDRNGRSYYDYDIYVPSGTTIKNHRPSIPDTELIHNEFIVFEPDRILIKFIVEIYKH